MKKRKINILIAIIIICVVSIYFVNLKYKNLQKNNPKIIENTKEKRQQIKVPPIETTEVTEATSQDQETTNILKNEEINNSQNDTIEQIIQEDPKTPEYTEVENLPKVLEVEEPTTDESMKKPEVIHNELKIETTTK